MVRTELVGYFEWVGLRYPDDLLYGLAGQPVAAWNVPRAPRRSSRIGPKKKVNECVRDYIGLAGKGRSKRQIAQTESRSPWDWTGQDFPVNSLMQLAVENPKAFCTLIVAAFLRPPSKQQRGLAARRAWEQRQQAGGER